ncbi:MAG: PorV/PorQ family protein [Candidatus Krumholzibacteriota bacterium]|nr:PorV/PorQ family protein [Candidatus Krumholzibacteriota bacterium]
MKWCSVGVCLLIALSPMTLRAEKYAGEFMALGGGARAMAMGGAFAAIADDATATFWNPAGLADFSALRSGPGDWELALMNSERFGNLIDYHFFSLALPLKPGKSAWGLSLIHMGIDDIRIIPWKSGMVGGDDGDDIFESHESLNFNYRDFPLESANDYALFLSYAQVMNFGNIGASAKLIRNDQVTGVSSFGIGIDIGFLHREMWKDLRLGVKLQDATGTYISWSTGKKEFIYPALKVGWGYPLAVKSMNSVLLLAVDGDFRFENRRSVSQFWLGRASADFHLGAELLIRDLVALRGGYDMGRLTAGAGFFLEDLGLWDVSVGIDYALLIHDELDTTHRISLLVAH